MILANTVLWRKKVIECHIYIIIILKSGLIDLTQKKIGHIATNHSTWDLELENLPLESLVLIYADFRVKNKIQNNEYKMYIYTLEEAYDIILNKLDNLDAKKKKKKI